MLFELYLKIQSNSGSGNRPINLANNKNKLLIKSNNKGRLLILEQIYKRRRTGGQNLRRLKRFDNNQVLENLTVL